VNVTTSSRYEPENCVRNLDCCRVDRPYSTSDREELRRGLNNTDVHFVEVPMYGGEALEPGFTPEKFEQWRRGKEGAVEGFRNVGYLSMCRLYSGRLQRMNFLSEYKYYMRMDDDSLLVDAMPFDPFREMERENLSYAFKRVLSDRWGIGKMWEITQRRMSREQLDNMAGMGFVNKVDKKGKPPMRVNVTGKTRSVVMIRRFDERGGGGNGGAGKGKGEEWSYGGLQPYNNFHVSRVSLWYDPRWLEWENDADRIHGFTKYHWGDANVHAMALGLLLRREEVEMWPDVPYMHNTNDFGRGEYPKPEWRGRCRFHRNSSSTLGRGTK